MNTRRKRDKYKNRTKKNINNKLIVILGNKFKKSGEISDELKKRVIRGADLYNNIRTQNVKILMVGGKSSSERKGSEAEVMKRLAIKLGVNKNKIHTENRSLSTIENAKFNISLINKYNQILLVTSRCHLKRSLAIFKKYYKCKIKGYGV